MTGSDSSVKGFFPRRCWSYCGMRESCLSSRIPRYVILSLPPFLEPFLSLLERKAGQHQSSWDLQRHLYLVGCLPSPRPLVPFTSLFYHVCVDFYVIGVSCDIHLREFKTYDVYRAQGVQSPGELHGWFSSVPICFHQHLQRRFDAVCNLGWFWLAGWESHTLGGGWGVSCLCTVQENEHSCSIVSGDREWVIAEVMSESCLGEIMEFSSQCLKICEGKSFSYIFNLWNRKLISR